MFLIIPDCLSEAINKRLNELFKEHPDAEKDTAEHGSGHGGRQALIKRLKRPLVKSEWRKACNL